MTLSLEKASAADAPEIAALRTAVAADLTARFGKGHWSRAVTEHGALHSLKHSVVLLARDGAAVVGVLRLATKKPWAIDTSYFAAVKRPLYLTDLAVKPGRQGQGIGRRLLEAGIGIAKDWPADAIRLDAYDAEAGGGGFYIHCGFREVGRVTYRENPLIYFELVFT